MVTEMARRTKAQWQALIQEQQSSGLIAAEFCRRQGVDAKYFGLRKKQLARVAGEFVKVSAQTNVATSFTSSGIKLRVIEVELPLLESSQSASLPLLLDRLLR
jgi:hypothetical protein